MRRAYLFALLSLAVVLPYTMDASGADLTYPSERNTEYPGGRLGPPGVSSKKASKNEDINVESPAEQNDSVGAPARGASSSSDEPLPAKPRTDDSSLGSGILGEPGNPPGTSTAGRFERLDTNHDGYISRGEARKDPALNSKFSSADKDQDGRLSDAEYRNIDQP